MLDLKQPLLGVVATLIGIVISLSFIALFDLASFTGTAATITMCVIPAEIMVGVFWQCQYPKFAANAGQPLRGLLLVLVTVVLGALTGAAYFYTVGGGIMPPMPMLTQCLIVAVVVTFFMSIVWGGWPFSLISNRVVAGVLLLISVYVINYLLFQSLFNYDFLRGAPIYDAALDPGGRFDGWSATVFYVTAVGMMFVVLHFDLWPLYKVPALMKQPVLGIVWTALCIAGAAVVFHIGTVTLGMDAPAFMVKVPVPFIFGTIVVLNMLQGSLTAKLQQPLKGIVSFLAAALVGTVLAAVYGALAPAISGSEVPAGAPTYTFEIWLASALLAVTFPVLIYYADFFGMWLIRKQPDDKA
ncbi:MAG: hypothetical protein H6978_15400 [Gammaproteobacteria bacterium]|nr:hypothetical protein [Gammaproteobacteria bacterium]